MEKKVSTTNISKHWRNRNTKELGSNAIYFKVQGYDPNPGPCSSVIAMTSLNYSYKNNNKNSNKNERRCRDTKTQKACKQGWEANIGPNIEQTTSI